MSLKVRHKITIYIFSLSLLLFFLNNRILEISGFEKIGLFFLGCIAFITVFLILLSKDTKFLHSVLISTVPLTFVTVCSLLINGVNASGFFDSLRVISVLLAPWGFALLVKTEDRAVYFNQYANAISLVSFIILLLWISNYFQIDDRLEFLGMHKQKSSAILCATSLVSACGFFACPSPRRKIILALGFFSSAFLICFSDSQVSQLFLLLLCIASIIYAQKYNLYKFPFIVFKALLFTALLTPICAILITKFNIDVQILREISTGRIFIWEASTSAFLNSDAPHWLVGLGPSHGDEGILNSKTEHNSYIALLCRLGAVGLICFLWWLYKVLVTAKLSSDIFSFGFAISLILIGIFAMFTTTIPFGFVLPFLIILPVIAMRL